MVHEGYGSVEGVRRARHSHGGGGWGKQQAVLMVKGAGAGGGGRHLAGSQSDSVMLGNQEEPKYSFSPPTASGDLRASLGSATDLEILAKSLSFSGPQFPPL